ncbi:hypothetical protein PMAYCL1PPCAC_12663, partial [Pristionchus mayeri]
TIGLLQCRRGHASSHLFHGSFFSSSRKYYSTVRSGDYLFSFRIISTTALLISPTSMSSESDLLSALEGGKPSSPPNRRAGLIVAGVAGGVALAVSLAAIPFLTPALRKVCIPYVPATPTQLANVTRALGRTGLTPKELGPLIDLGSGDGRVVLECAKQGIASSGVELNSILVAYSK